MYKYFSREEQELVSREKNLKKADEGQFAISRGKFFPNPHPITDSEHWINSSKDLQEYYNLKDKEAGGLALLNA